MNKTHTLPGYTPAESDTFRTIFNYPNGISASSLSKITGQPRGTIYGHLEVLVKNGLVTKTLHETGTLFTPEPIEVVEELYNQEVARINTSKKNLKHFLKREVESTVKNPKFTIFEGSNVAERYFKEILRSDFDEMVGVWPAKFMAENVPSDIMNDFQKNRIKRGKKIRILWPENEVVDIRDYPQLGSPDAKKSLREIRILPKHIKNQTAFIIYGTKVTFLSPKSEYYGFTIDSTELRNMLFSQFEHFWSISKKYRI